jgi:hypothetical protein
MNSKIVIHRSIDANLPLFARQIFFETFLFYHGCPILGLGAICNRFPISAPTLYLSFFHLYLILVQRAMYLHYTLNRKSGRKKICYIVGNSTLLNLAASHYF